MLGLKKGLSFFMILTVWIIGVSCAKQSISPEPVIPQEDTPEIVIEEKHSEFYMEEYSVEDVLTYFNEIVLRTEYATGDGDAALVQRWDVPICYQFVGEHTKKDVKILKKFFAELNKVEGFAGATEATEGETPNLYIYFEGRAAFNDRYMEFLQDEYADGATRYWYYTDTNDIYEGTIGYCTDMDKEVRKSVLLEEIVNCLGTGDTTLREDSIVYQYGSDAKTLSDMDWLIIKLLYHPRIRCGMDAAQCEEVIRELYY